MKTTNEAEIGEELDTNMMHLACLPVPENNEHGNSLLFHATALAKLTYESDNRPDGIEAMAHGTLTKLIKERAELKTLPLSKCKG